MAVTPWRGEHASSPSVPPTELSGTRNEGGPVCKQSTVSVLACLVSAARSTSGIEEPTQLVTRTSRSSEFAGCCGGVWTAFGGVVVAQAMHAYGAPATLSREAQAIKRPVDLGPV